MALVKCTECRELVSTLAAACPKCGAPVRLVVRKPDAKRGRRYLWLIGIVASIYVLSFPVNYIARSIKERQEASAQLERQKFAAKQLNARAAEWQQSREPIVAEAKKHFIEGRPVDALRLLSPWEPVLDGEARAILAAAKPQVAAILVKEKQVAQAAAAKALSDAKEAKEASCRRDVQCWGKRHIAYAEQACAPMIEAYALNNFEWTDGWGEKFNKALLEGGGRITYLGDYIKFQNGFGAWLIMNYECTYDPATKRALSVTVRER